MLFGDREEGFDDGAMKRQTASAKIEFKNRNLPLYQPCILLLTSAIFPGLARGHGCADRR